LERTTEVMGKDCLKRKMARISGRYANIKSEPKKKD